MSKNLQETLTNIFECRMKRHIARLIQCQCEDCTMRLHDLCVCAGDFFYAFRCAIKAMSETKRTQNEMICKSNPKLSLTFSEESCLREELAKAEIKEAAMICFYKAAYIRLDRSLKFILSRQYRTAVKTMIVNSACNNNKKMHRYLWNYL